VKTLKFTKTLKCQVVTIFLVGIMATLSPVYAQGTNAVIIEKSSSVVKSADVIGADAGLNPAPSNDDSKQNPSILLEMAIPQCGGIGDAAAIAAVIIVVGYILVRGLKKLCDKLLPPPPSPPPPPPNPGTNTNHAASAVIRLNETQTGGGGSFPGIVIPFGNPGDTNGGSWNSASTGVNMWNIYEYAKTNSAFRDPSGYLYTVLMAATVLSSTNLVAWQKECSVTGWLSSASTLQVWYTNGTPIMTNFYWSGVGTDTNSFSFPLNLVSPDTVPQKFFRMSAE